MLLKDVLSEFLLEIKIKNYTERTIKSYRNTNTLFITFIEKQFEITELEELNHAHIKYYVKFLMQQGRKSTYINTILKTIRSFLEYCFTEGYIPKNPSKQVKWQKEEKVIIKTFTNKEVSNMLDAYTFVDYLKARNKTIIAFLVDTGIRNFELCQLINSDVRDNILRIFGKGNKERFVPISPLLQKYIVKYLRIRNMYFTNKYLKHENLFLSNTGLPLTKETIERIVTFAGNVAGIREEIRCSPHTCRHYFAQAQLINGLDIYSLSRLMGHETIDITKRYLQSLQDENIVEMSVKTSPLMNLKQTHK